MEIGGKILDTDKNIYIMGILNCTPDSFSDGGMYDNLDKAYEQAVRMIAEGADIIDVGGESTRPGYTEISPEEELERILPVIKKIKENHDVIISVDTYKSQVALGAIEAGADIVNDIWGLKKDEKMAKVIAKAGKACVLMHNRDRERQPYSENFMADILEDLKISVDIALKAGIKKDKIILDPGVGFGKNLDENLTVTMNVDEIKKLGYPVLLATSRKSMIGNTLNLPKEERLEGTIATTVAGVLKGCSFFRVHDVQENRRAALMAKALLMKQMKI